MACEYCREEVSCRYASKLKLAVAFQKTPSCIAKKQNKAFHLRLN